MLKRLAQMALPLEPWLWSLWAPGRNSSTLPPPLCQPDAAGLTMRVMTGTASEARALMIVERPEDTTVWLPFADSGDLRYVAISYPLTNNRRDV